MLGVLDSNLDLALRDAARLVGCLRGLSKRGATAEEFSYDPLPMKSRRLLDFDRWLQMTALPWERSGPLM